MSALPLLLCSILLADPSAAFGSSPPPPGLRWRPRSSLPTTVAPCSARKIDVDDAPADSTATTAGATTTTNIPAEEEEEEEEEELESALHYLASTTLALLSGDEDAASSLSGGADRKRSVVSRVFRAYDVCESGTLNAAEARALFADLARSMVVELSRGGRGDDDDDDDDEGGEVRAARAHARRVLADDESGNTIDRVAGKLLLMADSDGDGKIDLRELARLFETVFEANLGTPTSSTASTGSEGGGGGGDDDGGGRSYETTFPQPLRALAGSLQLLPPRERANASDAADRSSPWNVGVPGDDHTLRRVVLEYGDDDDDDDDDDNDDGVETATKTGERRRRKKKGRQSNSLSLIGLGRSADASAYFLPELGIALDAGLHVSSLEPKTVLLTHGHRDHIGALPVHASRGALLLVPESITGLVRRFLIAEAQLNYGDPSQTDEATTEALGMFDISGVSDGTRILLPKGRYAGSPTPIGVKVISAPHKTGVPSVSYGIFTQKQRLREEYRGMGKSELGALLRAKRGGGGDDDGMSLTEIYDEGILFYTGDTQITLLRERWREICPAYKYIIHEVTFLGPPSSELDSSARRKGHTHYAQLHPWICAFPDTVFICAHWSLRYKREEVLDFFEKNYGGVPRNVVLWL